MPVLSSTAPARLQISRDALAENYRTLRAMTKAAIAPVVKADAYGLGISSLFATLRKEGARQFFVATPDEARELRALDKDIDIFVLGGFYAGTDDLYLQDRLTPVLNSLEEIVRWKNLVKKIGRALPAALHFDTGMSRLGLEKDETKILLDDPTLIEGCDLRLVMSHFACSDEKDHEMNERQAAAFAHITRAFPNVPKSLCNSSGIFRNKNWHYDLLRPGNALYGGNPTPETNNPMRSIVDLSVRILQIKPVKAGETAGYGATHPFTGDTSLAIVALGYADGFHRTGSDKARLYWNGQACPAAGRISMDLTIVDIGQVTGKPPKTGDFMEVLGPHQDIQTLARDCGTIGYEILTSLGKRYERIYI